jgi:hypothetical protein
MPCQLNTSTLKGDILLFCCESYAEYRRVIEKKIQRYMASKKKLEHYTVNSLSAV